MTPKQEQELGVQMYKSFENDPGAVNQQNHGSATGGKAIGDAPLAEDLPLQKALAILKEGEPWEAMIKKYHKDVHETQLAAKPEEPKVKGRPAKDAKQLPAEEVLPKGTSNTPPGSEKPAPEAPNDAPAN
jgi:hypothetical protein